MIMNKRYSPKLLKCPKISIQIFKFEHIGFFKSQIFRALYLFTEAPLATFQIIIIFLNVLLHLDSISFNLMLI